KKWRDAGELQYRIIDGKVMYFRREPSNLFRFSQEAKQRAHEQAGDADQAPGWKLIDHLKKVVADGEATGKSEVCPLNHRIEYSITIPAKTAGVRAGSLARIWLPYPQEYRQQKDVKLISATLNGQNYDAQIAPNGAPQRTVYFQQRISDPATPTEAK